MFFSLSMTVTRHLQKIYHHFPMVCGLYRYVRALAGALPEMPLKPLELPIDLSRAIAGGIIQAA
jgi:hypothetical protein